VAARHAAARNRPNGATRCRSKNDPPRPGRVVFFRYRASDKNDNYRNWRHNRANREVKMSLEIEGRYENELATRKQALAASVECLYDEFSTFALRPVIEGCPHCINPNDQTPIHSKALRSLTAEDLQKYAWKAMTTWGNVDDFRHFLPRLLELLAEGDFAYFIDNEIITGKLRYAHWENWTKAQRGAVNDFFKAYWNRVMREYPISTEADVALCAIGNAVDDVNEFLTTWGNDSSLPSVCHLADFIDSNSSALRRSRKLQNAFWGDRRDQMEQVLAWLQSPSLREHIERMFYRYEQSQPILAASLSTASDTLKAVSSSPR
jgi:hypothetical protein